MRTEHLHGHTFHKRLGEVENAFRYGVDFVLFEPEVNTDTPLLFSQNSKNLMSIYDRDHGGKRGAGHGVAWVRTILRENGLGGVSDLRVLLLTQPRILGVAFNPVSFWLILDSDDSLRAVIAEVDNTFGDRHSYLCYHDDLRPIQPSESISASKALHVSPYQPLTGSYRFKFNFTPEYIGIRIEFRHPGGGVIATLTCTRVPLSSSSILRSLIMRPIGSMRVVVLIYWQALKLRLKGAQYRPHSEPPKSEVS